MSQAEDLLNSLSTETPYSADNYVTIGSDRELTVPRELRKLGVSPDHGVNTIHFVGPRYSENGTDLSKMNIWVNYMRADGYPDQSHCENVTVDSEDETKLHYDWVITRNVTEIHGDLVVLVCAKSVDAAGFEENHWNSERNNDFYVVEGLEVQESIISQYPDLIEYMLLRVATVENKTTKAAMLSYVEQYLDEDPSIIIEHIEKIIAEQPIQEFVNEYLDEYVDICTTEKRTLEGSYTGAYEMVSMEGVSEQAKYEGYNLLENTAVTKTVKGVTCTVNEDGSVTLNGTSTDVFSFAINENLTGLTVGEEYTITGNPSASVDYMLYFDQKDADGNALGSGHDYGSGKTATIHANYHRLWVGIFSQAGVTFNNLTFYPMIRKASIVDSTYEPYCGGNPSPSPEHPQEIKSVGSEVTVRTTGKNFFGGVRFAEAIVNSGATAQIDYEAKTLTLVANFDTKKTYFEGFKENTQYTFFIKGSNAYNSYKEVSNLAIWYTNGTYYSPPFKSDGSMGAYTTPSGYTVDRLSGIYAAGTSVFDYEGCGIIEGVWTVDDFEAYKESSATITLSDELRSNGDGVSDIIKKKDGKWGVERWITEAVIDGVNYTVSKNDGIDGNDNYMYACRLPHSGTSGLSPQLIHKKDIDDLQGNDSFDRLGFSLAYRDVYLFMNIGHYVSENSVTATKAYLTENPITIQYARVEPIWEELDSAAQEALDNLKVYNGVTHVFVEGANVQPVVMSKYGTSECGAKVITQANEIEKLKEQISDINSVLESLIGDN